MAQSSAVCGRHCTAFQQEASALHARRSSEHLSRTQKPAATPSPAWAFLQSRRQATLDASRWRCAGSVKRCQTSSWQACRGCDQQCTASLHFESPRHCQTEEHNCVRLPSFAQRSSSFVSSSSRSLTVWLPHLVAIQSSCSDVVAGAELSASQVADLGTGIGDSAGRGHLLPAQVTKSAIFVSVRRSTAGAPHFSTPWPRHFRFARHTSEWPKRHSKPALEHSSCAFGRHSAVCLQVASARHSTAALPHLDATQRGLTVPSLLHCIMQDSISRSVGSVSTFQMSAWHVSNTCGPQLITERHALSPRHSQACGPQGPKCVEAQVPNACR
mmetsp:Transcript_96185/g.271964  ORF Transcript_96185/g.271964 Transcript_96185/m.271964 type:complete len:328 (+) Transcript_96185:280-1263(+)